MSALEDPLPKDLPNRSERLRARRWTKLLVTFLTGQTLLQGVGLITGLLLLRWMSVESYAQYSVAFAFQTTVTILVDLGFAGSVVALVGERADDPHVIGGYIRCARTYRGRAFYVLAIGSMVAFPIVVRNQPWPWGVKLSLAGAVLAGVFFSSWNVYRAPLLIHQRLRESYRADVIPALGRLLATFLLHGGGLLLGWLTAWFSAATSAGTGYFLRRSAQSLATEPDRHDPEMAREMVRYLAPLWPEMVFFALQGQITVALVSSLGSSRSIAEIAALGRLGQILGLLSSALSTIAEPIIARSSRDHVKRKFLLIVGGLFCILASLVAVGYLFPDTLVLILGSKYTDTRNYVGTAVLTTCVGQVTLSFIILSRSRKWASWADSIFTIVAMLGTQVGFLIIRPLHTTEDGVAFGLTTALAMLVPNATLGIYRLIRPPHLQAGARQA